MKFENLQSDLSRPSYRALNERNYIGTRYLLKVVDVEGEGVVMEPLEARFYCTSTGAVYCWCWVRLDGRYGTGVGRTYGWGYDKESAAFASALVDAGVVFEEGENFHAAGMDTAMDTMRRALEKELGSKVHQIYAHA